LDVVDVRLGLPRHAASPTVIQTIVWEDGMSIGVIATLRIQDGKGGEFEAFFTELAKQVRANEPGNVAYQLTKSRTEANTYKVLELYKDQDALTHHGGTEYFKAAGPKFAAVLAGRPDIEYLDGVG
jgi:quinol monooxygenase YgiN